MSKIDDLISKIDDEELQSRIREEIRKLKKQKKFGLVYEEHLPEALPLYDVPIKQGSSVVKRNGDINEVYYVSKIDGSTLSCIRMDKTKKEECFDKDDMVTISQFGQSIYPFVKPLDSICNAPDSDLWHILIESDNYHALQLLVYLYGGKVDCIYIDPPYNTGAKDWKYNNDYVDGADSYRHSKWLSFMEHRLKLAKKLLNPKDSVLIVTIDEKEYLHLGCLLEQMFPECKIQMISSCINNGGSMRSKEFTRTDEYIFFVMMGESGPLQLPLDKEWRGNVKNTTTEKLRWRELMRHGDNGTRKARPNLFYPIFVSQDGKRFLGVGEPLPFGKTRNDVEVPEGAVAIWPLHQNGIEGSWGYSNQGLLKLQQQGYVKLGNFTKYGMSISFIQPGWQKKIIEGEIKIKGYAEDGSVIVCNEGYEAKVSPKTQWSISSHIASEYGTKLINTILCQKRFSFPKSLYAVHDAIRFFVANKPNALILDFFAGSGTTLHAVNLLNAEDSGNRKCIMVTNNEISIEESKRLRKQGYKQGDEEWEKIGVARYVTWARTKCSIKGQDINGTPLKGTYLGSEIPMSDGFKSNAIFFKLGFLDKNEVALGRNLKELLPLLWMKANAIGECPTINSDDTPEMLILPHNKMAILMDEDCYPEFREKVNADKDIETIFIATDSDDGYREMISRLNAKQTYQLYGDYLDNFTLNHTKL